MSRIALTEPAAQDLANIYRYIAQDNVAAADKHRQRLEKRWMALLDHPRMGTKRGDLLPDLRSLTEGNYVIFYRIVGDAIQIARILHASQDAKRAFLEMQE